MKLPPSKRTFKGLNGTEYPGIAFSSEHLRAVFDAVQKYEKLTDITGKFKVEYGNMAVYVNEKGQYVIIRGHPEDDYLFFVAPCVISDFFVPQVDDAFYNELLMYLVQRGIPCTRIKHSARSSPSPTY